MGDELTENDPFDEKEEADKENLITEAMVKKATYHIHKLAERRGADYKEIQKKCKKLLGYENLAKVTLEDGHRIIDKLVELTGGEEEEEGARVTDDLSEQKKEIEKEPAEKEEKETKTEEEEDVVTATMRKSIRAAVDITIKEVVDKEVPVQGLGGFVLEISKVIFEAKMSEEVD
jgi:hypothetical protein